MPGYARAVGTQDGATTWRRAASTARRAPGTERERPASVRRGTSRRHGVRGSHGHTGAHGSPGPGGAMRVRTSGRSFGRLVAGLLVFVECIAACAPGAQVPRANQPGASQRTVSRRQPPAPSVAVAPNLRVLSNPIPFQFEENRGQAGPEVALLLRAGDLRAELGARGVTYHLFAADPADPPSSSPSPAGGLWQRPMPRSMQQW